MLSIPFRLATLRGLGEGRVVRHWVRGPFGQRHRAGVRPPLTHPSCCRSERIQGPKARITSGEDSIIITRRLFV